VRMRIFNADGGEVEACGNANRAVALLLGGDATLDTLGGLIQTSVHNDHAVVTLQKPRFAWDQIPLSYAMDTAPMPVGWEHLEGPSCVNVGNPHAVFFVEDCDAVDLARLGPLIEMDPLFPGFWADARLRHGCLCDCRGRHSGRACQFSCPHYASRRRFGNYMGSR
jgi:diaminopimelate epimerase